MIVRRRSQLRLAIALALMNAIGLVFIVIFADFQSKQRREGVPAIGEVQAAYDRAATAAGSMHDADLKIVQLDCRRSDGAPIL